MAKQKKNTPGQEIKQVDEPTIMKQPEVPAAPKSLSLYDFKVQAVIVALLAFIFYINTYVNEYAHDDGIVIVKNEYVMEGFAGLGSIFSKDAYASYYKQLNTVNQLSGGRYRPLSIATFAIEQQFFGAIPEEKMDSFLSQSLSYGIRGPAEKKLVQDMHVRHFFNVLWYMAAVVVLLYFLRYIVFKNDPIIALLATIIFTIHPIHTEVVANVKSRDEIMSLLFMCLTMILAFRYEEQRKIGLLAGAMLCFLFAFLSKEYAITLVVLIPLLFYLFKEYSVARSIKAMLPYLLVVGVYFVIRAKVAMGGSDQTLSEFIHSFGSTNEASEKEVLNNPYTYATHAQKIATEIATTLNYLKLLIFPHPLSADYSYNSIPYKNFGDWQVWLSIIVHLSIIGATAFFVFMRKTYKVLAFAFAFYMFHLLLVNNLVFNIGATMGERLIFHSSVGFAIVVAIILYKFLWKANETASRQYALAGVVVLMIVLCGFKTIKRNLDWKNDQALFMQDINVVPNSVLVNGNVAASYISMSDTASNEQVKNAYLHKAIKLLGNAIESHPGFVAGFLNQGIAYYKLGVLDSAKICLDSVRKNYPNYPTLKNLYYLLGDYHMRNGWTKYGKIGK